MTEKQVYELAGRRVIYTVEDRVSYPVWKSTRFQMSSTLWLRIHVQVKQPIDAVLPPGVFYNDRPKPWRKNDRLCNAGI